MELKENFVFSQFFVSFFTFPRVKQKERKKRRLYDSYTLVVTLKLQRCYFYQQNEFDLLQRIAAKIMRNKQIIIWISLSKWNIFVDRSIRVLRVSRSFHSVSLLFFFLFFLFFGLFARQTLSRFLIEELLKCHLVRFYIFKIILLINYLSWYGYS